MNTEHLTYQDMNGYYSEVIRGMCLAQYRPDVIFALARGGLDMGIKLSHYFQCGLVPITWQLRDHGERDHDRLRIALNEAQDYGYDVLIVDDMIDTGGTMSEILDVVEKYRDQIVVGTACAIENTDVDCEVTWSGREISRTDEKQWFVFPWEDWWK